MSSNATTQYDFEKWREMRGNADWETFERITPLELADQGDGRTLIGRVVPYGVVADVADPPNFTPYKESFAPGAFRAQLSAANRIDVLLNYEHRQGISDIVGRGVSLEDKPDGLYGTFRMLTHADGDKALELYHAGVLRGMSTEFSARKSRTVDGVVERVDARIGNVALCREFGSGYAGPKAAYQGAEVLAVRTEPGAPEIVVPMPIVPSLDLERLALLGIEPILSRAFVRKPWDGSPDRFTDDEYQRSCLIDRGGDGPVKERCSLPVLEPDGDVNVNALAAAAGRLRSADAPAKAKASAARKMVRLYRTAGMAPPAGITTMAGQ